MSGAQMFSRDPSARGDGDVKDVLSGAQMLSREEVCARGDGDVKDGFESGENCGGLTGQRLVASCPPPEKEMINPKQHSENR
jgi:hypothetical protein